MSDRLLKESDVLKAIDKRIEALSKDPEFVRKNGIIDVMGIKKYILAIPSADRPQGERIPNSPFTGNCSECGADGNLKDNYCSNCGARMFAKDINVPNKKGADDGADNI